MPFSLKAMWTYKCPRCRRSKIYTQPFELRKLLNMPDKCLVCGLKFESEPGYFFGAMFLSYGIAMLIFLPIILMFVFVFKWSFTVSTIIGSLLYIFAFIRILRLSRSLWLHLLITYKPEL